MGTEQQRTWQGHVYTTMSLDGYIADSSGDALWPNRLPEGLDHASVAGDPPALNKATFSEGLDVVMLGRLSYERLVAAKRWPFGDTPVYIASRTFPPGDPRISGVFRTPDDAMEKLNALGVTSVHVDGGRNIQGFLKKGYIDTITVQIKPVILGGGISLFGAIGKVVNLRVMGTTVTKKGGVRVTYAVER